MINAIHDSYEEKIKQEIAALSLSASHDYWHIDRVIEFAYKLHAIYGGEWDVIKTAALLHDLGRVDPEKHGVQSIEASVMSATRILDKIEFPEDKKEQVIVAIREHDQPLLRPITIEGKILKDADFLAGFGSWGILRICLWAGETGGGVEQIMHRLEHKMIQRVRHMEFPESEYWAKKEFLLPKLFVSSLKSEIDFISEIPKGKYILMEGISCSGKDTQAVKLKDKLASEGFPARIVYEPTDIYKKTSDVINDFDPHFFDNFKTKMFMFMADRFRLIKKEVIPYLNSGDIVISVRSYLSTLVYQCEDELETDIVSFLHKYVPLPDLVILYDLDAEIAMERRINRARDIKDYNISLLNRHREKYLSLIRSTFLGKSVITINSSLDADEVASQTFDAVMTIFEKEH